MEATGCWLGVPAAFRECGSPLSLVLGVLKLSQKSLRLLRGFDLFSSSPRWPNGN